MERLFPSALIACIGEGRSPDPMELTAMAAKVGREAFTHDLSQGERQQALNIARAALVGQQLAAK